MRKLNQRRTKRRSSAKEKELHGIGAAPSVNASKRANPSFRPRAAPDATVRSHLIQGCRRFNLTHPCRSFHRPFVLARFGNRCVGMGLDRRVAVTDRLGHPGKRDPSFIWPISSTVLQVLNGWSRCAIDSQSRRNQTYSLRSIPRLAQGSRSI